MNNQPKQSTSTTSAASATTTTTTTMPAYLPVSSYSGPEREAKKARRQELLKEKERLISKLEKVRAEIAKIEPQYDAANRYMEQIHAALKNENKKLKFAKEALERRMKELKEAGLPSSAAASSSSPSPDTSNNTDEQLDMMLLDPETRANMEKLKVVKVLGHEFRKKRLANERVKETLVFKVIYQTIGSTKAHDKPIFDTAQVVMAAHDGRKLVREYINTRNSSTHRRIMDKLDKGFIGALLTSSSTPPQQEPGVSPTSSSSF